MNDLYRETFDEIHASEALRQEVLNMTKQEKAIVKRQVPRMLLIAAIVVLVLAGTALAAAPGIRQWFSRQWTQETGQPIHTDQLGLIDQLSDAVGVSAASGGVTVTVDSVTRGEDVIWFLLELDGLPPEEVLERRLEEQFSAPEEPLPEEERETFTINDTEITISVSEEPQAPNITGSRVYSFGGQKISFDPAVSDPSQGYAWAFDQDELRADGSMMLLLEYCFSPIPEASLTDTLNITLEFSDLKWGVYRTAEIPLAEGPFTLELSLPAIKQVPPLTIGGGTARGEICLHDLGLQYWDRSTMGPYPSEEMAFQDIKVTSTSFQIYWADREQTERLQPCGDWYLIMADGTEALVDTSGSLYEDLPDGQRISWYHHPVPVNLRQVKSLEYRYWEEVQSFALK